MHAGTCASIVEGCTYYKATNFNINANVDDGSCYFEFDCNTLTTENPDGFNHVTRSTDCTLSGELTTTGDLEIVGQTQDMDNLVTITAASNKRHFTSDGTLTLRYLKLTGGDVTGADWPNYFGGAIYNNFGILNLDSCIIFENKAKWGGGIMVNAGNSVIDQCHILNNEAELGGGISVISDIGNSITSGDVKIYDSIINNNKATKSSLGGGGIALKEYSKATIKDTTLDNNEATGHGGGLYVDTTLEFSITRSIISNNEADTGGGFFVKDTGGADVVNIRELTFTSNTATNGNEISTEFGPAIRVVNTDLTDVFEESGETSWKTCSDSPCTEAPFNGTCTDYTNNVVCASTGSCPSGKTHVRKGVTAGTCEPIVEGCMQPAANNFNSNANVDDGSCYFEFDCNTLTTENPEGLNNVIRSTDCTLSGEVTLTGDLEIIGQTQDMDNLVTITAATGQRHFKLVATDAAITFTLRYLELTGGIATESCVDDGHCMGSGGGSGGGSIFVYTNTQLHTCISIIVFLEIMKQLKVQMTQLISVLKAELLMLMVVLHISMTANSLITVQIISVVL